MFSSKRNAYRLLLSLSAAFAVAFYMSPAFSADSAAPTAGTGINSIQDQPAPDYLTQAANIDLAEVTLGRLAKKKATNADVKALAHHMAHDHSRHSATLKNFAAQQKMSLPQKLDPEHQKLFDKLDKLSGAEFDEAFASAMVDGHKKAIAFYEKASKSEPNAELRSFFAKTLPTLQDHLRMAQKTDASLAASANGKEPTSTNVSTPDKTMKTR